MKQTGIKKILIPSLFASLLLAEDNHIEIGAGYMSSVGAFSTDNKSTISKLEKAPSDKKAMPYIDFEYSYGLNENTSLFTKLGRDGLQLGSAMETGIGMFEFGLKAGLGGDEWKNPFLKNKKRETTKASEYGAFIEYGLPMESRFQTKLSYEFTKKSYDKDEVIDVLKRDANIHTLAIEGFYPTMLAGKRTALISEVNYEKYDADEKASSYDQYGLKFGISSQLSEKFTLALMGEYAKRDYKAYNPEVNKTVETDIYALRTKLTWDKPFENQNTYVNFMAGYQDELSNAQFYDASGTFGLISVGYKF